MSHAPGLYLHVPFCARACPYCDFDFQVGRRPPVDAYLQGLERERLARSLPTGMPVHTVYVGGGTPSLLGAEGLRRLWAWIDRSFGTDAAVERTVELNPEHVDGPLLDALVEAGVDRVSLGVQSLRAEALVQLGRVHRAAQAEGALRAAAARGLRVSADLIVGRPGQSEAELVADVEGLLHAGVEHVSVYALTVEEGTPWERLVQRGTRAQPDPDAQADRLGQAAARLEAAGLVHYEVASYAREGARARHNLGYWQWRDYLGLGPSAASARFDAQGAVARRTNARGFERWVDDPGGGASEERLDPRAAAVEGLWVGLRVLTGLDAAAYLRRFPAVDEDWLRARVAPQVERGNLEWAGGMLRVAADRWLWHDEIGAALLDPAP
ncbi:MAG: radical SAM family heme chaperone HemW [Myxococcales bacterium]|nr:radical SAM family heme chaperone HemW [Myxococcales bacterium]